MNLPEQYFPNTFAAQEIFRDVAQLIENQCDAGASDFLNPAAGGTRASGVSI